LFSCTKDAITGPLKASAIAKAKSLPLINADERGSEKVKNLITYPWWDLFFV
jgi:hypothetical protein